MGVLRLLFIFLAWGCCFLSASGQQVTFSTRYLQHAAQVIKLKDSQLSQITVGTSSVNYQGYRLTIRIDKNRLVTHIGRQLFPLAMRQIHKSPVYDYLEYAYLDHLCHFTENPFTYKNLKFVRGNWNLLDQVTDETPCTINVNNDLYYEVSWALKNGRQVTVTFPIDYDKLMMAGRQELENNLIRDLRIFSAADSDVAPLRKSDDEEELAGTPLKIIHGATYLNSRINDDTYYDRQGQLVWSREFAEQSVANLLISNDLMESDCMIQVKFLKYDSQRDSVEVTVKDLMYFFRQTGCRPYWGIEEVTETTIQGSLFLYNPSLGYDHVLKITCPRQAIGRKQGVLRAVANLYVPTTRVKDLLFKYVPSKRKINSRLNP